MSIRSAIVVASTWLASACSSPPPHTATTPVQGSDGPPVVETPIDRTPPKLRLDTKVMPTKAAIELSLSPDKDPTAGSIELDVTLKDAGRIIWLNSIDLTITNAMIETNGRTMPLKVIPGSADTVGFEAPQPIPDGTGKLRVAFTGALSPKEHTGLFREVDNGNWYAFSKFESTDARRAFPCFDEPSFKIPWQLTLHVRATDVAVSNTPIVSETPAADGTKTVVFAETKPLPSYLVGFAVGPFELVEAKGASIPIRIVVAKGHTAQARLVAEHAPVLTSLLEKYFGIPFPYPKLDLIAIPDYPGAMENAGAVIFGQQTIMHDDADWTPRATRGMAGIVTHEVAHQWFGDLVTTRWWDDIWLNEAFATWMASKILESYKPEWRGDVLSFEERERAMKADSQVTARKIRQPIAAKTDIQAAFDGITYQKGAAILRMFETQIGPDVFQKGVHNYLEKYAWKTTTVTDFVGAIGEAAGKDVTTPFGTFLDQAGLPLLTVELSCKGAPSVTLTQERYVPMGSTTSPSKWLLPVCMRWPGGRSCTTMTDVTQSVPLDTKTCPTWLAPNDKAIGYYRVLPKGDLAAKLMAAPAKDISPVERMAVASDAMALARANKLPVADALRLVMQLARSSDPKQLIDAAEFLDPLDDVIPDDLRPAYSRLIVKLFSSRARQLSWTPAKKDDDATRELRPALLWATGSSAGDPAVVAEAKKVASRYLDDRKSVSPDIANQALAIAARHGDAALFDRMHATAAKTQDRDERDRLVFALGQFREPEIHKKMLAIALTDELPPERAMRLIFLSMNHAQTRNATWAFFQANYDALVSKLPRNAQINIPVIAQAFCDDEHRAEVESFLTPRVANVMGAPHKLAEVLEGIRACSAERAAQAKSLRDVLTKP